MAERRAGNFEKKLDRSLLQGSNGNVLSDMVEKKMGRMLADGQTSLLVTCLMCGKL